MARNMTEGGLASECRAVDEACRIDNDEVWRERDGRWVVLVLFSLRGVSWIDSGEKHS